MSSMEDIQICAVFNDGDDIGFVYSCNNGLGRPEFIARNVPRSGVHDIASTMNFLAFWLTASAVQAELFNPVDFISC
jgi:hypothetical protein